MGSLHKYLDTEVHFESYRRPGGLVVHYVH